MIDFFRKIKPQLLYGNRPDAPICTMRALCNPPIFKASADYLTKCSLNFLLIIVPLIFSCKEKTQETNWVPKGNHVPHDGHVHIMSPNLIKDWKGLGIPFSKPDYAYSNIDTILESNGAKHINLIGMAYVYGNPEFYQGEDEYAIVMLENDYLLKSANKHIERVRPYFAVDPLKDYAITEIKRCVAVNPHAGLKLHFNTSQVYLTEPEHLKKVKSIFEIASQHHLPILLHFDNWHPKFGRPDVEVLINEILADLKTLDLTIAHFGTSGGFNNKTKQVLNTFIEFFEKGEIPKRHKLTFDISAVALDKDSEGVEKLTDEEFAELKTYCNRLGYDRISFGTDYPLYSAYEYQQVLRTKLKLSTSELQEIMTMHKTQ